MAHVLFGLQLIVGALLFITGVSHLTNPYYFLVSVSSYEIIPTRSAILFAGTAPYVQAVTGLGLMCNIMRDVFLIIAIVLMLIYATAVAVAKSRGLEISCGCFGFADSEVSWIHAVLASCIAFLAVGLLWASLTEQSSMKALGNTK
jgi:hypothetical protein